MNRLSKTIIFSCVLVLLLHSASEAARIKGSPHDLTTIAAGDTCNFCHTPHGVGPVEPLWNHEFSSAVYKVYQSSSLDAKPGQPT
ncbi:MAG: hypothetical protein ACYS8Z_22515, partial [Planctomycetota bacterium]